MQLINTDKTECFTMVLKAVSQGHRHFHCAHREWGLWCSQSVLEYAGL